MLFSCEVPMMKSKDKVKLLIIGQTPPPYVGQMIMIENLVKAQYRDLRVFHTRMNYSQTTAQIGKVRIRKLFHLLRVIVESSYKIVRHRIDVVYYPPGADTVPILRDIATLLVLRCFRRKLILAFHASGLCQRVSSWRGFPFWLFRKAFFFPDAAIQKSSLNPPDGEFVKARRVYIVPNGCPDQFERFRQPGPVNLAPVILFVGLITEEKGVEVLIEAARLLRLAGRKFRVEFLGEFTSGRYRQKLLRELKAKGLEQCVAFCGRKIGDEKCAHYRGADIFCFPTHYRAESFGNVLLEAMMFELPVVSTAWRGVSGIVEEGVTGFLAEIKNPVEVAARLEQLLADEKLRISMGRKGRERYLEKFTLKTCLDQTSAVVLEVANHRNESRGRKNSAVRSVTSEAR
jgi:glycosyltransferase involved in cell wall biosynthesis